MLNKTKLPASLKAVCLAAALCAGASAQAAITVYTTEGAFLSAVGPHGVDTFDDLVVAPYGETLYRNAGDYTYQAYSSTGLWGAGGVGGDYSLSNNDRRNPIVFSNFGGGAHAFGGNFFSSDVFGQPISGNVVLTAADGSTFTYNLIGTTPNSFVGFVSDTALGSVTLGVESGAAYWATANNVVLAVPEPATYGMMLAGLGFLAMAARRRRG